MEPTQDTLYRVHQSHADWLGQPALPYEEFCFRLLTTCEASLTGLLPLASGAKLKIQMTVNARFTLGHLCIMQNVAEVVPADEVLKAIERHAAGDWGILDEPAWGQNDDALRSGGRLCSTYESSAGARFSVITEPGRMVTTVMLHGDH